MLKSKPKSNKHQAIQRIRCAFASISSFRFAGTCAAQLRQQPEQHVVPAGSLQLAKDAKTQDMKKKERKKENKQTRMPQMPCSCPSRRTGKRSSSSESILPSRGFAVTIQSKQPLVPNLGGVQECHGAHLESRFESRKFGSSASVWAVEACAGSLAGPTTSGRTLSRNWLPHRLTQKEETHRRKREIGKEDLRRTKITIAKSRVGLHHAALFELPSPFRSSE